MIHIVAACSLAHSLKDLDAEEKRDFSGHITTIPGLALNHNQVNRDKNLLNLLDKSPLRGDDNLVLWHDVIDNSFTSHRTNIFSPSSIGGLSHQESRRQKGPYSSHRILPKEGCPKRIELIKAGIHGIDKGGDSDHLDEKVSGLQI